MNRLKEFLKRIFDKGLEKYIEDMQVVYDRNVAGYRELGYGYSEAKEKAYKELKALYIIRHLIAVICLILFLVYIF